MLIGIKKENGTLKRDREAWGSFLLMALLEVQTAGRDEQENTPSSRSHSKGAMLVNCAPQTAGHSCYPHFSWGNIHAYNHKTTIRQ